MILLDLGVGVVAALVATWVMDHFSSFVYARQSKASRDREEALRTEMPPAVLAKKAARFVGRELGKDQANRYGVAIHWGFGALWGPVVAVGSRYVLGALPLGILTGLLVWLVVDEGMNTLLGLTPSAWEFPASAHFRSFANHVVYGATIGALVFLAQRISM